MIKEIEVGGVKHSITLADDMVGSGLNRTADGRVDVRVSDGLMISTGPNSTISVDVNFLCGSGLLSDGRKLLVDIYALSGSGLVVEDGKLNVKASALAGTGLGVDGGKLVISGGIGGGSVDVNSLCGSGLKVENGRLALSTGIAGSGLMMSSYSKIIDVDFSKLIVSGGGLGYESSGLKVNAGGGLIVDDLRNNVMIDYDSVFDSASFILTSGLTRSVSVRVTSGLDIYPGNGLKVKIAERSSGLRLFFNSNGELDVTQD